MFEKADETFITNFSMVKSMTGICKKLFNFLNFNFRKTCHKPLNDGTGETNGKNESWTNGKGSVISNDGIDNDKMTSSPLFYKTGEYFNIKLERDCLIEHEGICPLRNINVVSHFY